MEEQKTIKVSIKIVSAVEYVMDVEADDMEEATATAEDHVHNEMDVEMGDWLRDTMVVTSVTEVKEVVGE